MISTFNVTFSRISPEAPMVLRLAFFETSAPSFFFYGSIVFSEPARHICISTRHCVTDPIVGISQCL